MSLNLVTFPLAAMIQLLRSAWMGLARNGVAPFAVPLLAFMIFSVASMFYPPMVLSNSFANDATDECKVCLCGCNRCGNVCLKSKPPLISRQGLKHFHIQSSQVNAFISTCYQDTFPLVPQCDFHVRRLFPTARTFARMSENPGGGISSSNPLIFATPPPPLFSTFSPSCNPQKFGACDFSPSLPPSLSADPPSLRLLRLAPAKAKAKT